MNNPFIRLSKLTSHLSVSCQMQLPLTKNMYAFCCNPIVILVRLAVQINRAHYIPNFIYFVFPFSWSSRQLGIPLHHYCEATKSEQKLLWLLVRLLRDWFIPFLVSKIRTSSSVSSLWLNIWSNEPDSKAFFEPLLSAYSNTEFAFQVHMCTVAILY